MNNVLFDYALTSFGDDVAYLIENAFNQFEEYDIKGYEEIFFDILSSDSFTDSIGLKDEFYEAILHFQDQILFEHGIKLSLNTRLRDRVELLDSLKILQSLLDPTDALYILEQDEDELEIFSQLVEYSSMLRTCEVYDMIEEFNPELIRTLRFLILKQIENSASIEQDDIKNKIIKNAREFNNFYKNPTLGIQLMDHGLLIGEDFEKYIPFIEPYMNTKDTNLLAESLYTTIILSKDGYANPLLTLKRVLTNLPIDNTLHTKVESLFQKLSSSFETYKKGINSYK